MDNKKMKLSRVELLQPILPPDGGPAITSLTPLITPSGQLEVKALGQEGLKFPGFSVRSPRTGIEVNIPSHMIKAIYYSPEEV